jgi:RNA polymerase sigma-70 factor (ECF subfamily)
MKPVSLKEKFYIFKVRQSKDPEAYGKLYDLYVDRIFRFIFFKVSSVEEAEDLTADVFLKTWEFVNSAGDNIKNFNALIYRVARNRVIDYYRSKTHESFKTDEEQMMEIADKRSLADEMSAKFEIKSVETYLRKMKDAYREVLILRHIEEYSISEIAKILDKSKGNVRVLLHRATETLKDLAGEK